MSSRGAFITLEGIDGSGKSSLAPVLERALRGAGLKVCTTLEPGGTALGQALRPLLLDNPDLELTPYAELLLLVAARRQHVEQVIRPKLEAGVWVICDRFSDSSIAYQAARGVAQKEIIALHTQVFGDFAPDLTLLLDLPAEQGRQRAAPESSLSIEAGLDDAAKLDFQRQVCDHYRQLAGAETGRIQVLAADAPMEAVHRDALSRLEKFRLSFQHV